MRQWKTGKLGILQSMGLPPLGFCTSRVSRIGPKLFYHSASHIICVLNSFISLISLILSLLFRHLSAYTVILNFDFLTEDSFCFCSYILIRYIFWNGGILFVMLNNISPNIFGFLAHMSIYPLNLCLSREDIPKHSDHSFTAVFLIYSLHINDYK